MNKKVIILAHDFPPFDSIGGKRPASWFKHFKALGVDPVVVTRLWDNKSNNYSDTIKRSKSATPLREELPEGTIIRVPYRPDFKDRLIIKYGMNRFVLLRKIISFISLYFRFIFPLFDPTREIYSTAKAYMKNEGADFILATGEPFILFKYGALLSAKFKTPWIADYRDGWTSNQSNSVLSFPEKILNAYNQIQERKYVKSAAFISTAAPAYAQNLKSIFPDKEIKVVYNGFEEEVLAPIAEIKQQSQTFEIAYAGILYPYQQLEIFLEGYQKFIEIYKPKTRLIFYGLSFYPPMVNRVKKYHKELIPFLHFTERLPYPELMKKLRKSQIMLLLSNENLNWLSAKVFDYLAVNRKIVLVKNDFGILEKILNESNGGVAYSSPDSVTQFLATQYTEFIKHGEVIHQTQIDLFYSRKHQAARLVGFILDFREEGEEGGRG